MVASTSRRKAYQCLGVVAVLGYVLLISRHFSKDTVVILSSKRERLLYIYIYIYEYTLICMCTYLN